MADLTRTLLADITSLYSPAALLWLCIGSLLAGLVRGFTGFGTAMVFLPFAGRVTDPVQAITIMMLMDLLGPMLLAPRTLKQTNRGELVKLTVGAVLAMPLGVLVLFLLPPDMFRYIVSAVTFVLLFCLIGGVRYRKPLAPATVYGVGAAGGFFGGSVGLPGPPVIFLYFASTLPAAVIRANIFIYLLIADLLILAAFGIQGRLLTEAVVVGLLMGFPCLLTMGLGSVLFNPAHERLYRGAAYFIIAASAVIGLPVIGQFL
ncbi:MAG: TSUP family transporter [Rhodobacteraceae bacterium]|nr:TSUP family transporter [Paracoccaceae bacterium]